MVVGRGAAVCISALWSVHTGDQGPPPSQAHSLWALASHCSLNKCGCGSCGWTSPQPGRPQPFLLILNKVFFFLFFRFFPFSVFKLTTWKKCLGYLWFHALSLPSMPSCPVSGVTNCCSLCNESRWSGEGGAGSRPEGPQDPSYCSLASDNQLSFDRYLRGERKHSLPCPVHMKSLVLPPLLNEDIQTRH